MNQKNTSQEYFYYDLPSYVITNFFMSGDSTSLKYKDQYIMGDYSLKYAFEGNSKAYIPKDSFYIPGRKFISLLEENDPEFTTYLFEKYKEVVDLADMLQNITFSEIYEGRVPDISEYYDAYLKTFPIIIGLGYSIDTTMEPYVQEKEIDMESIHIPGESFIMTEERELQKVAQIENEPEQMEAVKKHAARWSFVHSNYKGYHPIELSYFEKRLAEVKEKNIKPKEQFILNKPTTLKEWIGLSVYIRDERKRANMLFNALYTRYIARECKTYNLSYEQAVMVSPDEFEDNKKSGTLPDYGPVRYVSTSQKRELLPITKQEFELLAEQANEHQEIKGSVASKGIVRGTAKIILSKDDFDKVTQGDIIVASMTRPEFVPILQKASAIVTNEGGITCHAAIISRELKIPCIIGTNNATKILKDGDQVEVDADNGVVKVL